MEEKKAISYFAAANSYRGFVSYFDSILEREDPTRLFVIKGGPGTGKSSLMKKLYAALSESGCEIELIYCSSDPNSLDGVIARRGERCIAIIDGTAPHTRDARVPGAIDELVDLGENWDERWLTAKKDTILKLNAEKANAYSAAYSYLGIAGEADRYKSKIIRGSFDFSLARQTAMKLLSEYSENGAKNNKMRLVSSFGKLGEYRLKTIEERSDKLITLSGDEHAAYLFLSIFSDILGDNKISFTHFPAALSPENTEAVSLYNGVSIVAFGDGERIDADAFLGTSRLDLETVKRANELKEISLEEARRWFAIASDIHFRLEEIYTEAMNFEKNDEKLAKILEKCVNILEI